MAAPYQLQSQKKRAHMPIRQTLQHIPDDRPVAVLLRHAERFPIHAPDDGWTAPLTDRGPLAAEELGVSLAPLGIVARTSPIPRARQTAAGVLKGAEAAGSRVVDHGVLDELAGPYLTDATSVMEVCLELGDKVFVRRWFDEALVMDGLMRARMAALGQLEVLMETLASAPPEPALHIHFSHDWNILLIREHFLGLKHEDIGMPPFLDGLVAFRDQHELVLRYREVETARRWRRFGEPG